MAILDVGPFQEWIKAHENYERAKRLWDAANRLGHQQLIMYVRADMDQAERALHAAIRALKG